MKSVSIPDKSFSINDYVTGAPPMHHTELKNEGLKFEAKEPSLDIPFIDCDYERILRKSYDHSNNGESNGNIYHDNEAEFQKFAFTNTGFPMGAAFSPLFSIMSLHKVIKQLKQKYPNLGLIMYADDGIFYQTSSSSNLKYQVSEVLQEFESKLREIGVNMKAKGCRMIYDWDMYKSTEEKPGTFKFLGLIYDIGKDLFYSSTRRGKSLDLRLTLGVLLFNILNKVKPYFWIFGKQYEIYDNLEVKLLNVFSGSRYHSLGIFYEQSEESGPPNRRLYTMYTQGLEELKQILNLIPYYELNSQIWQPKIQIKLKELIKASLTKGKTIGGHIVRVKEIYRLTLWITSVHHWNTYLTKWWGMLLSRLYCGSWSGEVIQNFSLSNTPTSMINWLFSDKYKWDPSKRKAYIVSLDGSLNYLFDYSDFRLTIFNETSISLSYLLRNPEMLTVPKQRKLKKMLSYKEYLKNGVTFTYDPQTYDREGNVYELQTREWSNLDPVYPLPTMYPISNYIVKKLKLELHEISAYQYRATQEFPICLNPRAKWCWTPTHQGPGIRLYK